VSARGSLKAVAVLDPAELLDVVVPEGKPRLVLGIRLPNGSSFTADLNAKSVRRAIAAIREHGADTVAVILQGKLEASRIIDAGLSAQLKAAKPASAEAAQ
jgi:hypothetical protein